MRAHEVILYVLHVFRTECLHRGMRMSACIHIFSRGLVTHKRPSRATRKEICPFVARRVKTNEQFRIQIDELYSPSVVRCLSTVCTRVLPSHHCDFSLLSKFARARSFQPFFSLFPSFTNHNAFLLSYYLNLNNKQRRSVLEVGLVRHQGPLHVYCSQRW